MADTTISGLAGAGALDGTEAFPLVQSGATKRGAIGAIRTYLTNALGLTRATTATSDPAATDDAGQGYGAGSSWLNTVTGIRWTCIDASGGAAAWVPMGSIDHPGYISGQGYPVAYSSLATSIVEANKAYAVRWNVKQRITIASLGVRIATAAAGSVKMAIYANDAGMPGAMIAETVEGSTGSVATVSLGFGSTITLSPGLYWIATLFDAAPQVIAIANGDRMMAEQCGGGSLAAAYGYSTGRSVGAAYPAFPSPLTGTAVTNGISPLPSFMVA